MLLTQSIQSYLGLELIYLCLRILSLAFKNLILLFVFIFPNLIHSGECISLSIQQLLLYLFIVIIVIVIIISYEYIQCFAFTI